MKDISHLVGIPYKQMNCWELAQKFYSEVLNVELKSFITDPKDRSSTQNLIYTNRGDFLRVDEPEFGDIIVLKVWGLESHIGVYIGEGRFIHSTESSGSHIDRIARWGKNVCGYYRPPKEV